MRDKYANIPLPPAHRTYRVGDEVKYGNHDEAIVTEVSPDGRIYTVRVTNNKRKSYQTEDVLVTNEQIVTWIQLMPIADHIETEQFSNPDYYPLTYQQRDISGLLGMVYSEYGFDFDPDYQRGHVWELEDKVALIDSIMAKRDIGKFVINNRKWHDTDPLAEIIDGKQRLSAIKEFYEDGFAYKGKLFSQLHPIDRNAFRNKAVSVATLEEASREEILETFLAVNITGRQQNLDHLENVKTLLKQEHGK